MPQTPRRTWWRLRCMVALSLGCLQLGDTFDMTGPLSVRLFQFHVFVISSQIERTNSSRPGQDSTRWCFHVFFRSWVLCQTSLIDVWVWFSALWSLCAVPCWALSHGVNMLWLQRGSSRASAWAGSGSANDWLRKLKSHVSLAATKPSRKTCQRCIGSPQQTTPFHSTRSLKSSSGKRYPLASSHSAESSSSGDGARTGTENVIRESGWKTWKRKWYQWKG